jgi:hypothetical protein
MADYGADQKIDGLALVDANFASTTRCVVQDMDDTDKTGYVTAETLAQTGLDSEEDTYTVTVTPADSGTVTLDSVYNTLAYEVVRNLVHIHGSVEVDSVSSPVGILRFSLPFTIANLSGHAEISCGTSDFSKIDLDAGYTQLTIRANGAETAFHLTQSGDSVPYKSFGGTNTLAGGEIITVDLTFRKA